MRILTLVGVGFSSILIAVGLFASSSLPAKSMAPPNSDAEPFTLAMKLLDNQEHASCAFLRTVGADESRPVALRRMAIAELCRRFVHCGTTVDRLGELLGGDVCIRQEDISKVTALRGLLPIDWVSGDSIFVIRVIPVAGVSDTGIYIRIPGDHGVDELWAAISKGKTSPAWLVKQWAVAKPGDFTAPSAAPSAQPRVKE
jgi:hypothetical protein